RQQCHLARALDGDGDLALVAPARAADPPRADLPLLGDVAAQLADVLVVDLVDLALAEEAGLAAAAGRRRRALPAPLVGLRGHVVSFPLERNVVVGAAAGEVGVRAARGARGHELVRAPAVAVSAPAQELHAF